MAVKHRIRICVGYNQDGRPILKQLGANSETELGDMAVRAILASERKGEFIQDAPSKIICLPDAKENAAPLLGDYAWTWFRTYKAQNIKPTTANFYNLLLRNICQGLGRGAITTSFRAVSSRPDVGQGKTAHGLSIRW